MDMGIKEQILKLKDIANVDFLGRMKSREDLKTMLGMMKRRERDLIQEASLEQDIAN